MLPANENRWKAFSVNSSPVSLWRSFVWCFAFQFLELLLAGAIIQSGWRFENAAGNQKIGSNADFRALELVEHFPGSIKVDLRKVAYVS